MKESSVRCLVVYKGIVIDETKDRPVRRHIEIVPFKDGLSYLQSLVDGYIDHYSISSKLDSLHIDMWINDEGKFRDDFSPTFALLRDGQLCDVIVGPCVFSKFNDEGETLGLSPDDVNIVIDWLQSQGIGGLVSKDGTSEPVIIIDL